MSGVDESGVEAASPAALTGALAALKVEAVHDQLDHDQDRLRVLVGCDSMLELDGIAYGKPHDAAVARQRWQTMRGRTGILHTGHRLIICHPHASTDGCCRSSAVASTQVRFADLTEAEIDAYVATGEPLQVAGAFTLDGLGGAFVTGIDGDPHTVVGISLPLLRTMLADLGIAWPSLWAAPDPR